LGVAAESDTIRIGDDQTATFIAGISGSMLSAGGDAVIVSSAGQLGIAPSSARYKRDVHNMAGASRGLMKLRPVTFHYRSDPGGQVQYGLIAEEVARVYPEIVGYSKDGKIETVRYQELIPLLLNELQKQAREIARLKTEQEREKAAYAARLTALEQTKAHNANGDVAAPFEH
jgi:hypothetical protein